jgi:hypothetical protein
MSAEHTIKYKLPAGIVCEAGCVLQWEYYSMQSCIEPGCNRKYCGGYADGDNVLYNSNLGFCGRTGAQVEFFSNCADIRILPAGAHYMGSGSGSADESVGVAVKEAAAVSAAGNVNEAAAAAHDGAVKESALDVAVDAGADAASSAAASEAIAIAAAIQPHP